jgi:SAM-dependent methyltransferase
MRYANLHHGAYSTNYGADRGLPIDRIYIADFLAANRAVIRGRTLEFQGPVYSSRFGNQVSKLSVIDLSAANPNATIVGDICTPGLLEPESFDCEIVTQVLQFVADPPAAIQNLWRALAPGGTLLLTVPSLSRIDPTDTDYWRWTALGLGKLLSETIPDAEIQVASVGNATAAAAFMLGLSTSNVGTRRIREHQPDYPVLVHATVRRSHPSS